MDKGLYRSTSSYYEKSRDLIKTFVEYELGGRIDALQTFCFDELRWGSKFCNPEDEEWSFDCDNTALIRAIYVVLWGHVFNIKEGDIGAWNKNETHLYRGDTINSFNSLFGEQPYLHRAKNHNLDFDMGTWKNVTAFMWQYHTIGNFILLPNKGNLNCERGRKGDYFDLLLLDIANYKKDLGYAKGVAAIKENPYLIETDFGTLKDTFFLDPYFDKNNNPKNLYDLSREERRVQTLNKNEKKYLKMVDDYLKKSEEIIQFRAQKMIEELKRVIQ
jgi:hypothetical protein